MKSATFAGAAALFAILTFLTACRQSADDGLATGAMTPQVGQTVTATGTLQGGMMAVGGETTGWTLTGTDQLGDVMVDVSEIEPQAREQEGRRVTVTGRLAVRDYVERGPTQVILVERIEPSPDGAE